MTDLEIYEAMLKRAGLEYHVEESKITVGFTGLSPNVEHIHREVTMVTAETSHTDAGYSYFSAARSFSKEDGSLVAIGGWE